MEKTMVKDGKEYVQYDSILWTNIDGMGIIVYIDKKDLSNVKKIDICSVVQPNTDEVIGRIVAIDFKDGDYSRYTVPLNFKEFELQYTNNNDKKDVDLYFRVIDANKLKGDNIYERKINTLLQN